MLMGKPLIGLKIGSALGALSFGIQALCEVGTSPYTTGYRYDSSRRLIGEIHGDPDGTGPIGYPATRYTYDSSGRLAKTETGSLASWQSESVSPITWPSFTVMSAKAYSYDAEDRKIQESESSAGTLASLTQYSYDIDGNLECTAVRMNMNFTGSACAAGQDNGQGPDRVTRFVYDQAGRVTQVRKAVGTSIESAYVSYTYNKNGSKVDLIDSNGNKSEYQYDGLNRVRRLYYSSQSRATSFDGSSQARALATSNSINMQDYEELGYDANDNRVSLRKRDGSNFTFGFDALNRMTSKIVPDGCAPIGNSSTSCPSSLATRDIYYGYDLQGFLTNASFDSPSGDGIRNSYDSFGHLLDTTTSIGGVRRSVVNLYDKDGNRSSVIFDDKNRFDTVFDGLDHINSVGWTGTDTQVAIKVSFDIFGRRVLWQQPQSSMVYHLDGLSRLTRKEIVFSNPQDSVNIYYNYNNAAQVVQRSLDNQTFSFQGALTLTRSYLTNGLNQYSSAGAASFRYDANGSLLSDGTTSFSYDAEGRLINSGHSSILYDPLGRVFQVSSQSGVVTQFLWNDSEISSEYDGTGALVRKYMFGDDDDNPILVSEGGTISCANVKFFQTDQLGSIVATAACDGSRTSINAYDESGIPDRRNTGRFQFTGQAWLPEIGMYYYKARFYSPTLGRFVQADPAGFSDQLNLYSYLSGDPVNGRDPDGECPWCFGAGVGAVFELGDQLRTSSGRAPYVAAYNSIIRGNFSDGASAVAPSLAKVALAGISGALGAGVALKSAGYAAAISKGVSVGPIGKVAVNATVNMGMNATAGGLLGGSSKALSNLLLGVPTASGVKFATIGGAAGGATGSLVTGSVAGEAQNLATSMGRAVGSREGVAVPGVVSKAADRAGGTAAAVFEKAGSSLASPSGCAGAGSGVVTNECR